MEKYQHWSRFWSLNTWAGLSLMALFLIVSPVGCLFGSESDGDEDTNAEPDPSNEDQDTNTDDDTTDDTTDDDDDDDDTTTPVATALVDCNSDRTNVVCTNAGNKGTIGSGPLFSPQAGSARFGGGFIDGNELIIAAGGILHANGSYVGGIFGINLRNGNRRIISGHYVDANTRNIAVKGMGPGRSRVLGNLSSVVKNSNGNYLAAVIDKSGTYDKRVVYEINPRNGNWSNHVDMESTVPCDKVLFGEPGAFQGSMAIDNADRLYAYYNTNGNPNDSHGILQFSKQLDTCVSRNGQVFSGTGSGPMVGANGDVGGGTRISGMLGGLIHSRGKLYAIDSFAGSGTLMSINIPNGARTMISSETEGKGTGPKLGGGWIAIDERNNEAWVSGICFTGCSAGIGFPIMKVNLANGNRTGFTGVGGMRPSDDRRNPIFVKPGGDLVYYADSSREVIFVFSPAENMVNVLSK